MSDAASARPCVLREVFKWNSLRCKDFSFRPGVGINAIQHAVSASAYARSCRRIRILPKSAADCLDHIEGIRHDEVLGYFHGTFAGYSEEHRMTSASGGLVTWLLRDLLERGESDGALCVGPDSNSPNLFGFRLCHARTISSPVPAHVTNPLT